MLLLNIGNIKDKGKIIPVLVIKQGKWGNGGTVPPFLTLT
jgi:hypothetical protein